VADRGSGIPAEELQRIFDRYYRGMNQRDVGGGGIGLAIAREIVVAHGGRIWARSEGPGSGSTFFVALPVFQPAPLGQPLESTDGRGPGEQAAHQA
jgi:signal transduction histidine kinase